MNVEELRRASELNTKLSNLNLKIKAMKGILNDQSAKVTLTAYTSGRETSHTVSAFTSVGEVSFPEYIIELMQRDRKEIILALKKLGVTVE